MNSRIEKDSMGEVNVPANALYGAQTQRALNNFTISGQVMPPEFISALGLVKKIAAKTNLQLDLLDDKRASEIMKACDQVIANKLDQHFPIDVYQTGSGTSSNMNANEVIANVAAKHTDLIISANDHVNMCQSSNDVIPTTIHVASAIEITNNLLPALRHLHDVTKKKSEKLERYVKTGRTHLMDAMPITMSQELSGWQHQIRLAIERIESSMPRLLQIAQGGTAVGTGINAAPEFAEKFADNIANYCQLDFLPSDSFFSSIASMDSAVEMSGQLKTLAVSLIKIANDLRWMNSGPLAGLAEIELEALQPGSSIMPGKVNPVIPESVAMACTQVIGHDQAITVAGQSGNFQLNVMLPLIAYNLLQSIHLLTNASRSLADKAIKNFKVNEDNLGLALARNPILVTALNPIIGYDKAAEIAKKAYRDKKPIIEVAASMTDIPKQKLKQLLNPLQLSGKK